MAIASIKPAEGKTIKTFESLSETQIDEKLQLAAETFRVYHHKNCPAGALDCRPKQRQALLQWAYDSRRL